MAEIAGISVISEALLILIIGYLSGQKLTFSNAVLNGVLVMIAGGTLLFGQKPLGFLLLVYSSFINLDFLLMHLIFSVIHHFSLIIP